MSPNATRKSAPGAVLSDVTNAAHSHPDDPRMRSAGRVQSDSASAASMMLLTENSKVGHSITARLEMVDVKLQAQAGQLVLVSPADLTAEAFAPEGLLPIAPALSTPVRCSPLALVALPVRGVKVAGDDCRRITQLANATRHDCASASEGAHISGRYSPETLGLTPLCEMWAGWATALRPRAVRDGDRRSAPHL